MTTTITQWTTILNEGAVGANATMPTIAAGTNRRVLIVVAAYNGGGNSQPPASITVNGITRNQLAGDTVARDRTSLGLYLFTEAEVATISGQTITSTATGTQKSIIYKLLGDATQGAITHSSAYSAVTANLTMSLARVSNSQTELIGFSSTTGQILTSTNPSNDGNLALTSGRRLSYADQAEAADVTNDTVVNGNARTSAIVFNIGSAVSLPEITSVNGGAGVRAGSTGNTASLSNFANVPSTGTLNSLVLADITGTTSSVTFTVPGYVDGQTYPNPNISHTLTLNASGGETANISVPLNVPLNNDTVTFATLVTGDPRYLADHLAISSGDKFIFPTEGGGFEIFDDGGGRASTLGTRECWWWKNSNSMMTQVFVTVNDAGIVKVSTGMVRMGLGIGIGIY